MCLFLVLAGLNVLEVGDAENEMSDDETDINGITGPNNETIYISAEILQEFNSSGKLSCCAHCKHNKLYLICHYI